MDILYALNRLKKILRGSAITQSKIDKRSCISSGSQVVNTTMDSNTYCGYDCKFINCSIGSFTSIADRVVVGGTEHPASWVSTSCVFYEGKHTGLRKKYSNFARDPERITIIGSDVWIGEGAYIKAGVKISDGAIIGMGSVVTKSIGPYEIWAGNPAKLIRKRFDDEVIQELLEVKWWGLSDAELRVVAQSIRSPRDFLNAVKGCKK